MAKTWYPVIDYVICEECGECIEKCKNGVYDSSKAPSPIVQTPINCIDHCHGCGNVCPTGAITYLGEDTDWVAKNKNNEKGSGCGCGCS